MFLRSCCIRYTTQYFVDRSSKVTDFTLIRSQVIIFLYIGRGRGHEPFICQVKIFWTFIEKYTNKRFSYKRNYFVGQFVNSKNFNPTSQRITTTLKRLYKTYVQVKVCSLNFYKKDLHTEQKNRELPLKVSLFPKLNLLKVEK